MTLGRQTGPQPARRFETDETLLPSLAALGYMDPERRLAKLDADLPAAMEPKGAYRGAVESGGFLHVAGQGPVRDGAVQVTGRLGEQLDVDEGYQAARLTGLNVLAQVRSNLGTLDRVREVADCTVFVAATPDFEAHPQVADGVTELFEEVFGPPGLPARAAVGVSSLPMGIPVEAQARLALEG